MQNNIVTGDFRGPFRGKFRQSLEGAEIEKRITEAVDKMPAEFNEAQRTRVLVATVHGGIGVDAAINQVSARSAREEDK